MSPGLFTGAVLAGGEGRRMGHSKAQLPVGDERLLERQLRLLHEAGAADLLVAQHPDRPEPISSAYPVNVVFDTPPHAGPLGGVSALLTHCRTPRLLVVAVDLPCLNRDFLSQLLALAAPDRGVVPVLAGRLEPLAALYPKSALEACDRQVRAGRYAVHEWAHIGLSEGWLRRWELEPVWHRCLLNWNEPGDFGEAGKG